MPETPEQRARQDIDAQLGQCGWAVQDKAQANLHASTGVALRELSFKTGEPDYTLFVDGKAIGTIEAKPEGYSLVGAETQFTNHLDPYPRSRTVFAFHRPETLLALVQLDKQPAQRLREMPPLTEGTLWPAQFDAIKNLEISLAAGKPRALIQMATGSGKTYTAVNFIYRLVKYAGARRVLFLVDRGNLGDQTLKEFQQFVSPVNNYKFTDECHRSIYNLWRQVLDYYDAGDLDRDFVAPDQIRTVLEAFRDKAFPEMFPGRADLPKTLIFAKDDSHADDIVRICRDVFGKGNDFCQKITYRTGFTRIAAGKKLVDGKEIEVFTWQRTASLTPEQILSAFRNSYNPRIAVTVDMIATGTDIKPLEIVFFMRSVASKNFFEQMKGRGVRIVTDTEMEQVNPGVKRKTRYLIVDAVGVTERVHTESRPLEKKPTASFDKLLDAAALEAEVVKTARGQTLSAISQTMLAAIDPDEILAEAVGRARPPGAPSVSYIEPTEKELTAVRDLRIKQALMPLSANPDLRNLLKKIQKAAEQTIDIISKDSLLYAGPAPKTGQNNAQLATSFRDYIEQHKAEITALQILYSRPYRQRLTEPMLKELEAKLRSNHAAWTEDRLWDAFAQAKPGKVKGRSQAGRFADLVALVRFALEQQPVLKPFADSVHERFNEWLMDKAKAGVKFTGDQLSWLNLIRDHIATSCSIEEDDFDYAPFAQAGGLGKARQLFGNTLGNILEELNNALVA